MIRPSTINENDDSDQEPLMGRELSENDFVTSDIDSDASYGNSTLTTERKSLHPHAGSKTDHSKSRGGDNSTTLRQVPRQSNNNQRMNPYYAERQFGPPPQQYGGYDQPNMYYQCYPYQPPLLNRPNYSLIIICVICCATLLQISRGGGLSPYGQQQAYGMMYQQGFNAANNLRSGMTMPNMNEMGVPNMQGASAGSMNNGMMLMNSGWNSYDGNTSPEAKEENSMETTAEVASNEPIEEINPIQEATEETVLVDTSTAATILEAGAPAEPYVDVEVSAESSYGEAEIPAEPVELSGLENFKDTWEPWDPSDVPIFFHIPKAGGSSIKDIMGTCHRFVMATETGVTDGFGEDTVRKRTFSFVP